MRVVSLALAILAACSIRRARESPTPVAVAGGGNRPGPAPVITPRDTAMTIAQTPLTVTPDSALMRAIIAEGLSRSHVANDLWYLSDVIGPRLTGSAGGRRATDWTRDKFREYGVDSAWTESWRFGRTWERGPLLLSLVAPHAQPLFGASWAWAPGTVGPVSGDVIYMDARTPAEYDERFAGSVKGKWVMTSAPSFVWNSDGPAMGPRDSSTADSMTSVAASLTSSPDLVKEIERRMRVTDLVMKFITVRIDEKMKKVEKRKKAREKRAARKPPPLVAPPAAPAAVPGAPESPAALPGKPVVEDKKAGEETKE